MTDLVIFLFIAGMVWIVGKVLAGTARFSSPTIRYIQESIVQALMFFGMPENMARAILPIIITATIAIIIYAFL